MSDTQDYEAKFWKALRSDGTVMLGLEGVEHGQTRPMTAQFENDRGPIWFFTVDDTALVKKLDGRTQAVAAYASKGHDLFASIRGSLVIDNDPAVIDRLWNSTIAAWYEGGKSDPKLRLLRLDAESADVWVDASSFLAGIKLLLGMDPKQSHKDNMAEIPIAS